VEGCAVSSTIVFLILIVVVAAGAFAAECVVCRREREDSDRTANLG